MGWIVPAMWALTRIVAFLLQLIGAVGLIAFGFAALLWFTDKMLEETDANEQNQV